MVQIKVGGSVPYEQLKDDDLGQLGKTPYITINDHSYFIQVQQGLKLACVPTPSAKFIRSYGYLETESPNQLIHEAWHKKLQELLRSENKNIASQASSGLSWDTVGLEGCKRDLKRAYRVSIEALRQVAEEIEIAGMENWEIKILQDKVMAARIANEPRHVEQLWQEKEREIAASRVGHEVTFESDQHLRLAINSAIPQHIRSKNPMLVDHIMGKLLEHSQQKSPAK